MNSPSFIEIYCLYLQEYSIFRIYDGAFISSETTANVCTFTRLGTQRTLLLIVTAMWPSNWQYWCDGIRFCPRKTGIHANLSMKHTEVTHNLRNPQAKQGGDTELNVGNRPPRVMKMLTGKYCLTRVAPRMTMRLSSFIKTYYTTRYSK